MAKFRRQITPTGRYAYRLAQDNYSLGKPIDRWTKSIVSALSRKRKLISDINLEDVLNELRDLASQKDSDFDHLAQTFAEAGWLERLQALYELIVRRQFPYKIYVATKNLRGFSDSSLEVEVRAVYEVNRPNKTVIFHTFDCFTPVQPDTSEEASQVEDWQ